MILLKFNWAPSSTLFEIGGFGIHIYSLMFIVAFVLGIRIYKKIFIKEKVDLKYLEPVFIYMVISTLLGARLGDVFFYSWDYYQNHWVEILLPIRGNPSKELFFGLISGYEFIGFRGLASHGASIGILIGLYLYQRKYKFKPLIWILDRLVIPISIGAVFVRIGNFFNSEIVGKYTNTNVGVVFQNRGEVLPRHPAQLYEAFGYIILFFAIKKFYDNGFGQRKGFLLGFFFTGLFTIRFIVEYIKESQGGFEEILPMFTTGQWLSIPFILAGFFIMFYSKKNKIS